jgi:hypothetical protein
MKYKKSKQQLHQEKYCQDKFNDKFDLLNHALPLAAPGHFINGEQEQVKELIPLLCSVLNTGRQKNYFNKTKTTNFLMKI